MEPAASRVESTSWAASGATRGWSEGVEDEG